MLDVLSAIFSLMGGLFILQMGLDIAAGGPDDTGYVGDWLMYGVGLAAIYCGFSLILDTLIGLR